jgi:manganese transport protein
MLDRLRNIGPGAMVAAAFIGPGTITTATIAGSSFGFTLLWAILFSILATYILQEMSARLGVIGGVGVATAIKSKISNKLFKYLVSGLVIAAILVGNMAYEAGNITGATMGFPMVGYSVAGLDLNPLIMLIGILAFILLFSGKYELIEKSLMIMVSIMGIVFLCSAIMLKPDLVLILKGLFIPKLPQGAAIMVIGLIGTTVVPYNLFLHASAVKAKWSGERDLKNVRWDTMFSIIFGGVITMAILITSAAVFDNTITEKINGTLLSNQLAPLLGSWSSSFMGIGFLAAGLSSSITAPLAAATVCAEVFNWDRNWKSKNFRMIWMLVLFVGILFSSLGYRPSTIILFAQVANGLLLPIVASLLLWVLNDKLIMQSHINSTKTNIIGAIVIVITIVLGLKGILSATNMI